MFEVFFKMLAGLSRTAHLVQMFDSRSCVRMSRPPAQKGQATQALGRSRSGFATKIHLKSDFDGASLAFHLTGGEAADSPVFPLLLNIGPDVAPRAALADKG